MLESHLVGNSHMRYRWYQYHNIFWTNSQPAPSFLLFTQHPFCWSCCQNISETILIGPQRYQLTKTTKKKLFVAPPSSSSSEQCQGISSSETKEPPKPTQILFFFSFFFFFRNCHSFPPNYSTAVRAASIAVQTFVSLISLVSVACSVCCYHHSTVGWT